MCAERRADTLADQLRLIVITDRRWAHPRSVVDVVTLALKGGAPSIQLRDKDASVRDLFGLSQELRALTNRFGALLFVNDRFDVALASGADGVHLGPEDIPVAAARRAAPSEFLVGFSTDEPELALKAQDDGADYIGCGAVFPTSTKADAGNVIGLRGLDAVARAVRIPVVAIGGLSPEGAADVATGTAAAGVAVASAVMCADEPGAVVRTLLEPWGRARGRPAVRPSDTLG